MRFYLGTHRPGWLATAGVPLFVSHRTLRDYRTLPVAVAPWALDSGGFTELSRPPHHWQTTPDEYVTAVRRYRDEVGMLEWAAPQDWMCEPFILAATGNSVGYHQHATVDNLLHLRELGPELPFVPVLQGWTLPDYLAGVQLYERAGVDLTDEPTVGIGSVCRRQRTPEIAHIVSTVAALGIRLHGFGVKLEGLAACHQHLVSADSMAWSFDARYTPVRLPGCAHRGPCANCQRWALGWREKALRRCEIQQDTLALEAR